MVVVVVVVGRGGGGGEGGRGGRGGRGGEGGEGGRGGGGGGEGGRGGGGGEGGEGGGRGGGGGGGEGLGFHSSMGKVCDVSKKSRTSAIVSQFSANNICFVTTKGIIAHSAPLLLVADLHTTFILTSPTNQSDVHHHHRCLHNKIEL